MLKKQKRHRIEALPLHKEICGFLIDNKITFKCYNCGLKAIVIDHFSPYKKDNFINEIMKKFNLKIESETDESYIYKSI